GVIAIGFDATKIIPLLQKLTPPTGRMHKIKEQLIWVDYAHTPDALTNALSTLKSHYPAYKIRVLFGCGGNRDQDKRAKMGKIACDLADNIILSNDNPRGEDADSIIAKIVSGIGDSCQFDIVKDRQLAIETAVITLKDDECLLIAGKGHETTQQFADKTIKSNDREIVKAAIIEGARLKLLKNRQ
ncbi:MAG: UDP-N-acetylmuramoyl-L-alanyl-D-glutamate--2,6-diaminopimelate ligase, partial [Candidatus Thioglobus sp.]